MEIHPKYLRYPRNFRDNLGERLKRIYLEQEGLYSSVDSLYYDTGFTGTIPEQMMEIQGFAPEEINSRIRLLSAPMPEQRVRGIEENARAEIINHIESNVKDEEAAFALIRDKDTGQLRPLMNRTSPDERFKYAIIKQAIARHYWFKEHEELESAKYIELTRANHQFHISSDEFNILPSDFIDNPQAYFQEKGLVLKKDSARGEEVLIVSVAENKKIIAKRVNLSKMPFKNHELRVLERAKELGLPSARPIGILNINVANGGQLSYILMHEIQGISGRNIRRELSKKGYLLEEIDGIIEDALEELRNIADKYREILKIDKPWRLKDCMIRLGDSGQVLEVVPLDWERAHLYNPNKPHSVKEK